MSRRAIIEIDQDKCDGCGQCVLACAEGALEIRDGKAHLVGEIYCDGLGACLGECPKGALKIIERQAADFDEAAVKARMEKKKPEQALLTLACGCPSSAEVSLKPARRVGQASKAASTLGHFPIKLQLLRPDAPFLKGADLLLLADCAAACYPDLHARLLPGRAVAMGCPKLDDLQAHIERLSEIIRLAKPGSITVVHMEVPCCRGFVYAAQKAIEQAGVEVPLGRLMVGRSGEILEAEGLPWAA